MVRRVVHVLNTVLSNNNMSSAWDVHCTEYVLNTNRHFSIDDSLFSSNH